MDPPAQSGQPWIADEIDVLVAAYFALLAAELRGERPIKAEVVRELSQALPARTAGSIERKLQNVSAVLDERDVAWIDGYKPMSHYQSDLAHAVDRRLAVNRRLSETIAEYQSNTLPAAMPQPLATEDVLVEPPSVARSQGGPRPIGLTVGPRGALQDFKNHRLGRAGEEWVLGIERVSLQRAGRDDLADRISWVANDVGDGAGFDISSFRVDGSPVKIEVKTTNFGPRTPFYITRWEVEVSRLESTSYSLYRVFDFRNEPKVYRLDGSVRESARLEPAVFLGVPG